MFWSAFLWLKAGEMVVGFESLKQFHEIITFHCIKYPFWLYGRATLGQEPQPKEMEMLPRLGEELQKNS